MASSSTDTHIRLDFLDPPNLTGMLKSGDKKIIRPSYLNIVYRCSYAQDTKEVAVKAFIVPQNTPLAKKDMFHRKMRREIGIWKRLDHPNIVPFLGTTCDKDFGSQYPCIVSKWMTNGALFDYVDERKTTLSLPDRIKLIRGSVAGLKYLHSRVIVHDGSHTRGVVHGDLHPGNILIDDDHIPRLVDFGLSQTLLREQNKPCYLRSNSVSHGAMLWAAPELVYPKSYPKLKFEATLKSDIYSLGSVILFILSGRCPWQDEEEPENKLKKFQNPPRSVDLPNVVWEFLERCWSPRDPGNRPSAKEVLSFSSDRLEQLLLPKYLAPDSNIIPFDALPVDFPEPPDLSGMLDLDKKHIGGCGFLSVVYRCLYANRTEVAVKAIAFYPDFDPPEKDVFIRKVKRELGIWKRLDHPNIVPLLGTTCGAAFGSDYTCMVSKWMPKGTLFDYVEEHITTLPLTDCVKLIKGSVAGLEYLHSRGVVHGDLHPRNIVIDGDHNPCLIDFGLSQTAGPMEGQLSCLYTDSIRPGAPLWAAPELLYPELYPDLKLKATLKSDIYPLGSIVLFILSCKCPWQDKGEAEKKLKEFQNPPRPLWPVNMPDGVWDFIEQCWLPHDPGSRPSAQEVLLFSSDRLEQLLLSNPAFDTNISPFHASPVDPPDLTEMLDLDRKYIGGRGFLSIVYRCLDAKDTEVAVKAITYYHIVDRPEKDVFIRQVRRELGIWKRLDHPNIVPLLGTACGAAFGSDYTCMVSKWMPNGTLFDYVEERKTTLSPPDRIKLIKGSVAGLEYLHSRGIVHGDLHPRNVVIDSDHNPCLIDFGLSQTAGPMEVQLSYLYTDSICPGASLWAAPELLYPGLYPNLKLEATLKSDIYPLGSIVLFVLSNQCPWRDRKEAEKKLMEFRNPLRPPWPVNMPDGVWDFIERCWSPRSPGNRPSAHEALLFSTNRLEQSLLPSSASDTNVVLFGTVGSEKSLIINLLVEKEVVQVSLGVKPCTERPRQYQISISKRRFRLWDTVGFPTHEAPGSQILPYEYAHAVLRSIPDGVNLILLCAPKGTITPSLRRLYWLVNDFFYGGRAPIAFIVSTPDTMGWERDKLSITQQTGIPIQTIPHVCVSMGPTSCEESSHMLKDVLQTFALAPIPLHPDFSSYTSASSDLTTHCQLTNPEATTLAEKFSKPPCPFNVVVFGETESVVRSIINLIGGHPRLDTFSGAVSSLRLYGIDIGMQQFRIWDTKGVDEVDVGQDVYTGALENACQLIHALSGDGGVDLLIFCKRFGKLTPGELNSYRLFEEVLCKRVAVIITHFELQHSTEEQWDLIGKGLINAVGHACIPSLSSYDSDDIKLDKKLLESRLSIRTMLQDCAISRTLWMVGGEGNSATGKRATRQKTMTVNNLFKGRYGLTKEQAKRLVRLCGG